MEGGILYVTLISFAGVNPNGPFVFFTNKSHKLISDIKSFLSSGILCSLSVSYHFTVADR